jgi:translation initiation factor IF-3
MTINSKPEKPQQSKDAKQRAAINGDIRAREVRLSIKMVNKLAWFHCVKPLSAAESVQLDLVEIVPNAEPPVCRIMDYGKHVFELKQKQKDAKKKQHQVQIKEIKLRPGTEEADYQVKLKALSRFLEEGDKAKLRCVFADVK